MSRLLNNTQPHNFNIGDWLSAKIYSDMKNGCSCGHDEWTRKDIKSLPDQDEPICGNAKCKLPPTSYVIVASVKDEDGRPSRIRVRHDQDGNRLKDIYSVVHTLKTVNSELKNNMFDIGKYISVESRESYKFSNIVEAYLNYHNGRLLRGEISPGGLKDKKTLIKNHLHIFMDVEIGFISSKRIREFFRSYTSSLRMRDKATSELKTIMYFAMNENKLHKMPDFPEISASKMVSSKNFLSEEKQALVISKIENHVYRAAIQVLATYGLRPCEVRSLKWSDIDFKNKLFYIGSHISLGSEIPGRKSQANSIPHELPIMPEFEDAINSVPRSIKLSDYIFKGAQGGPIGGNVLSRAWNDACKIAKVKNVSLYCGTKHSTLSNLSKTASDAQLIKLSGHTNTKIIRRYAQSNVEELRALLS